MNADRPPVRAGLALRDGRVEAITQPGGGGLDFGDALLLPGAVDVHVHTRSYEHEGIERCTAAAAAGGVTTIVDMPYDATGPVDTVASFEAKVSRVRDEAHVDVALWATVPPRGSVDQVAALVEAGAAAFKLSTFETHPQRFPRIPDDQIVAAFSAIAGSRSTWPGSTWSASGGPTRRPVRWLPSKTNRIRAPRELTGSFG